MCNDIRLFLLLSLTTNYVAPAININSEDCNSGATCMFVEDCHILYNILRPQGRSNILQSFKSLQCGFDGNKPKICCPPTSDFITGRYKPDTSDINEINKLNLLPNSSFCGTDFTLRNRIAGGDETRIDEHPWMALLNYGPTSSSLFYCSGVLISSRYVMTAAHCVKRDEEVKVFQVRLGEWNLLTNSDCSGNYCNLQALDVDVEETVVHENYNSEDQPRFNHDIALLRLAQDVLFNDFVRPICLPTDTELRKINFKNFAQAEIAGWGRNDDYSSYSEKKLKAQVSVLNLETCKKLYEYLDVAISDNQICAGGEKGKDICDGDSGGPLMVQVQGRNNWLAIGVASFGRNPCGLEGWPSVFTRVTSYIPWILSKIRP